MQESPEPVVRLFGSFSFDPQLGVLSGPAKRLLARLILGESRPYGRGELTEALWPDAEAERSRFYLRRALLQLRQGLGGALQVESTRNDLRLVADAQTIDVLLFDRLVFEDDEVALDQAIRLHHSPLLLEWADEWLVPEREGRVVAWHTAIERLAETDLRRDRPAEAARRLSLAVAADPLRESSHRLLIAALRRAGDPARADREYERFERRLRRELGLSPSAETRSVLREPVAQTFALGAAPASQRLVPVVTTELIGREAELRATVEALRTNRLVTLVGPGGVGKTRLALACAEDIDAERLDLIAMVDLASREDGRSLVAFLGRSVRAPLVPGRDPLGSVVRHLEDRRTLLILDNCEHLVGAVGELAQSILDRCPFVSILATSREGLGLPDETILDLRPLNAAASESLFRESADRKGRPVPKTDAASTAVRRVCAAVEQLPLGIVLAAAAMRTTSLDRLAEDLYEVLGAGSEARPRHRSLRSAIEWSYRLLSPEEASLLRSVSPLQGWWTSEFAVAAVGATDQVLKVLSSLVAKSLINMEEDGIGSRYRLLEPIREDAVRRLVEAGEEDAVRLRLRDAVLSRSEAIFRQHHGHPRRSELPQAEREIDVFESVLRDCLRTPQGRTMGASIVVNSLTMFDLTNRYREAAAFQEAFLADAPGLDPATRVLALSQVVHFRVNWGDAAEVEQIAAEALLLGRRAGDERALGYAILSQAMVKYYTDQFPDAHALFEEGLALSERAKSHEGIYSASVWAGKSASAIGEVEAAERHFAHASRFALEVDPTHGRAMLALNVARLRFRQERYDVALRLFEEAEESFGSLRDHIHETAAQIGRAACRARQGERREAADLIRAAEEKASVLIRHPETLYDGLGPRGFRDGLLKQVASERERPGTLPGPGPE